MTTRVPTVGLYRTKSHGYFWNGQGPFQNVTGAIDAMDKSGPLMGWAKRLVAEFAVDNLDWLNQTVGLVGRDQAVNLLKSKPKAESDAGKELGGMIHALIEDVGRGKHPELKPEHRPYVEAYRLWLKESGFKLVSLEKAAFNFTHDYAGTFDIIAKREGELWLIDAKTNKGSTYQGVYTGTYPETALQLAAYSRAEFIAQHDDPKLYPMPKFDRYAVLHLRPDAPYEKGYRLIEYSVTDAEFDAFLSCLALAKWIKERKGKVVGESPDINIKEAA